MTSHFNFKSLAFYGVAIGAVLLLFNVVTVYGEGNLKAPASIDGRYRLSLTQNLPNCVQPNALVLTIEQSGIYLNGSLSSANTTAQSSTATQEKLSLTGLLKNQPSDRGLSLSGKVATAVLCPQPAPQAEATSQNQSFSQVRLEGRVEGQTLQGEITQSGIPEAIGFTGQREAPIQPSEGSGSH